MGGGERPALEKRSASGFRERRVGYSSKAQACQKVPPEASGGPLPTRERTCDSVLGVNEMSRTWVSHSQDWRGFLRGVSDSGPSTLLHDVQSARIS